MYIYGGCRIYGHGGMCGRGRIYTAAAAVHTAAVVYATVCSVFFFKFHEEIQGLDFLILSFLIAQPPL